MEEKINNVEEKVENKIEQPTYEELVEAIETLKSQNINLIQKLRENNLVNMFRRMDYDFEIIKNYNTFIAYGKDDLVAKTVDEIEQMMSFKEEENSTEE